MKRVFLALAAVFTAAIGMRLYSQISVANLFEQFRFLPILATVFLLTVFYYFLSVKLGFLNVEKIIPLSLFSTIFILLTFSFYAMPKINILSAWWMNKIMHGYYFVSYLVLTLLISYFILRARHRKAYPLFFLSLAVFVLTFYFAAVNKEKILILLQVAIFCSLLIRPFSARLSRAVVALWRNNKLVLLFLILFTLATRAFFAYRLDKANFDPFILGGPDSAQYDLLAAHMFTETPITKLNFGRFVRYNDSTVKWLSDGGGRRSNSDPLPEGAQAQAYVYDYHKPLYTLFMGLIYKVFGHNPSFVRMSQVFMAALSVFFTYLIAKTLFSPAVGKIAAFLNAGLGWFLSQSIYIAPEMTALLFAQVHIYFLILTAQAPPGKKAFWYSALSGIGFAGLILTRPEMLLFLPLVFVYLFVAGERRRHPELFKRSAFLLLFILVTIAPWVARNYKVYEGKLLISPGVDPSIEYTTPGGYLAELSEIDVDFMDMKADVAKLFRNIPFLLRTFYRKTQDNLPRYWSWRSPLSIADFISFGIGTPFRFIQYMLFYLCLIIGLFCAYRLNQASLIYHFFILFFLATFCVLWYNYWHTFVFVPMIHTFEALGLIKLTRYLYRRIEI